MHVQTLTSAGEAFDEDDHHGSRQRFDDDEDDQTSGYVVTLSRGCDGASCDEEESQSELPLMNKQTQTEPAT